ncbi:MAG: excinuclease ABC subunit UvrC [Eubacteriales bacterium]|nr:excinuclease ABC subunit UvrC [Clostridiales bacterium]MDY5015540.1 excinuclease ABC subunit UvrC [Eubacteriales bacterium]
MDLEALREKANMCPQKPGVYRMIDASGVVIYVGKAKNLKNRVTQYFQNPETQWIKTRRLVSHIDRFETIVTDTELEALVLENTLIKHYQPKYNILLKDDKGYPFICFDPKADYPRLMLSAQADAGKRCFGPYGGRTIAHEVIDIVQETLKLPNCSRRFPRDIGRERPCLRRHLGRCIGVCEGGVSKEQYHALLEEAALLLEGRCDELTASLGVEMERAAEALDFERAAFLRDRLQAVERLDRRQKVVAAHVPDADVVCLYNGASRACIAVLHYVEGTLLGKDQTLLPVCEDDEDAADTLSQFVTQYYRDRPMLPREVLLSQETPDAALLGDYLTKLAGRRVYVLFPQRGEKRRLLEMAMENAREEARIATLKEEKTGRGLALLQTALGMENAPYRLEAYDISHTAGEETVGGMVVFEGGKPRKSAYRKFRLEREAPDDYASIAEVLRRRLARAAEGDEKFLPLPDVLLIDGGEQHAQTARRVLEETGVKIPVLGMVKDDHHRTRALVEPDGREIGIRTQPALFTLIGTIGEEVHRFAIGYHRTLRDKKVRKSALDGIPGVGEARKSALIRKFGSVKAIRAASEDELASVVPKNTAAAVYARLHGAETDEK